MGYLKEYWSARIIFEIASGIGIPIALDDATNKRSFGHYARVLVVIDLKGDLRDKIMVEREDFTFFVYLDFEKLPLFCQSCQIIGHSDANFRYNPRKEMHINNQENSSKHIPKNTDFKYVPKSLKKDNVHDPTLDKVVNDDLKNQEVINVEEDVNDDSNLKEVINSEETPVLKNGENGMDGNKVNDDFVLEQPLEREGSPHLSGKDGEESYYFFDDTVVPNSMHNSPDMEGQGQHKQVGVNMILSGVKNTVAVQDNLADVVARDLRIVSPL